MRNGLGLVIVLVGCSSSDREQQLPSATFTPHLESTVAAVACGQDTAFYGNTSPDISYAFAYDAAGHLSSATGAWANNGPTDTYTYTWAGDNLTHMLGTSGWDGSQMEITANYSANGLVDYTWSATGPDYNEAWTYAFSQFAAPNQPTREVLSSEGQSYGYQLVYDATDRLVQAIPDAGPGVTTWTYDDAAGTIDVDTDNGAYHGVLAYDVQYRLLSETWGGTAPGMVDSDTAYAWTTNQLDTITFRSGTDTDPHTLQTVQVDTMRYSCATARAGGTAKLMRPRPRI